MKTPCSIGGCSNKVVARGWCNKHWKRWRAHGDPMLGNPAYLSPQIAIQERTVMVGGCQIWTGSTDRTGYGKMKVRGKTHSPHRIAFELANGPIPNGKEVNHLCWNRLCCDPAHLELVSRADNMRYRSGAQAGSATGVRNVTKTKSGNFTVRVTVKGKLSCFGTFPSLEEAKLQAEAVRARYFGKYAGAS